MPLSGDTWSSRSITSHRAKISNGNSGRTGPRPPPPPPPPRWPPPGEEEEEEEDDDDDNSVYVAAPDPSILEQKDFDVRKEFLNGQVVWAHTELPIEDSKCKTIWWPAYVYHSMEVSFVRAAAT